LRFAGGIASKTNRHDRPATNTTRRAHESGVGPTARSACGHARNTLEAQEANADVVHSDVARRAGKALGATAGIGPTCSDRDARRRRTVGAVAAAWMHVELARR
jgi:hypothetical protein